MARLFRRLAAALALACTVAFALAGSFEDFFIAVAKDDAATIERLLARGFDVNSRDEKGQPALLLVMREGSFKAAEALLRHPALDVDASNAAGETALMMAALKGQLEWVRRLLDRGAKLERPGWTPLHYAATGPNAAIVRLLLERGAYVEPRSPNGSTPLMMAARYGSEEAVKALLAAGADAGLRNQRDMDAAEFARSAGRDALAAELTRIAR
jgi:ankyrin repeat protein